MSNEREYLVFRLYGPMAGWGDISVGEVRPAVERPSRSGIVGLLGAALGIPRSEEASLAAIADAYLMAVAVAPGQHALRDFHTIQRPPQRAKYSYTTRYAELRTLRREELVTTLSSRDYYTDSWATVVLWLRDGATAPYALQALCDALKHPQFVLYLGRKSCPLALPVQAMVLPAPNWRQALLQAQEKVSPADAEFSGQLRKKANIWLNDWPSTDPARLDRCWLYSDEQMGDKQLGNGEHTRIRRDIPTSRARWQFAERVEYCYPPQVEAQP